MVYVMLTAWIPADKARVFGKRVIEGAAKFPPDESVSRLLVQGASTSEGSIKAFSINEVVDGKITEALSRLTNYAIFYAEAVGERFKYDIETILTGMEAMRIIGLELPE